MCLVLFSLELGLALGAYKPYETTTSCKSMVAGVRCMSFDFQVFRVVVGPDLVLVVNRLAILQEPPNLHFRYDLMDINVSGAPCARVVGAVDNPIPSRG